MCKKKKCWSKKKQKKNAHLASTSKDGGKKRKKGKEAIDGLAKKKIIQKEIKGHNCFFGQTLRHL